MIELVTNPDIAAELGAGKRPGQILVAFAAETHDALENARGSLTAAERERAARTRIDVLRRALDTVKAYWFDTVVLPVE